MERYALIIAAVVSLVVTAVSGFVIVPLLRRLKFGQTIKEVGPTWHKGKQGTPTMGGFMFVIGSCLGVLMAYPFIAAAVSQTDMGGFELMVLGIITALCFGAIGFVDDYLKVVRKQNLGLRARVKIIFQSLVAISFLSGLHLMGRLSTLVRLPFLDVVDFSWSFYPIAFLLILLIVNAVNLTDGLDGLCSSVTLWVMCGFLMLLTLFGRYHLSIWAASLAGGCVGFLLWNFYPAKIFMGDTGSMFLGGAVVAIGFCMGRPDIMIILSTVYIIEALSVMMQVSYFKLTKGKRIFKMTPIHHHFEMMGWNEMQVGALFNFVTLICVVLSYIYSYVLG